MSATEEATAGSGAVAALRLRDFRLLWVGQAISTLGDQIFPIAVTIAVLDAGGTLGDLGLVLGARWLAIVSFALVGGVWADRLPRTFVMRASDLFRAVAVMALAFIPGTPSTLVLAGFVFAVGAGEAFFRPAEAALIPAVVPQPLLPAANGLVTVSYRLAAVIGPGIGGLVVVAAGGPRAAYVINAASFLVSLGCLTALREPARDLVAKADRDSMLTEIRGGLAEVRRRPWIAAVLLMASLQLMLVVAPESVLLPIIGRREFGGDWVYVGSLAAISIGGVIGAFVAMHWQPRQRGLVGLLGILPFTLVPLALAYPSEPWVLLAVYFVSGLCLEPFLVYWSTALQEEIPTETLARVSSVDWMASFALMPLGLALTGPAVAAVGETAVLWAAAVVSVVSTLAVLVVPGTREFRTPRADSRS